MNTNSLAKKTVQGGKTVSPRTRVTISDVADKLGLTKGTVSRALNGYTDISDVTRRKVSKAAEAMGYRPLSHAQAIRTGRVRALGLVLQINEHDGHRPFFADFIAGVTGAAGRENWTVTVATANSDADTLSTLERLVEERKADGFVLPRTYINDPRVDLLRKLEVPFVLYGRTGDLSGCALYDIRGEAAMASATHKLADMGHRRIAFVNGGPQYNYSVLRYQGYRDGLSRAGLDLDPELVAVDAVNEAQGEAAAMALLNQTNPPTAFVYAVDHAALGLYAACAKLGLRVGQDVSVMSYDGVPEGAHITPPLTTYSVDSRSAGGRLADLLIRRIRGVAPEDLREFADARFIERASHGVPAMSSNQLAVHLHGRFSGQNSTGGKQ